MRTNSFTLKMSKHSDHELETILEEKDKYTEEAIQAVIWELENRNLREKTAVLEEEVLEEISKNNVSPIEEIQLPDLYSKKSIQGFAIFFSTIFATFLLMQNFKEMKKPKARIEVLSFGIIFTIVSVILLNYLPKTLFTSLLFNLTGYLILIQFFWNKELGKDLKYKKKNIWKPLSYSILIIIILVFLQFLPQIVDA
jgi:hypothetical protein